MTKILTRTFDPTVAHHLMTEGFSRPIAQALAARGIEDASELSVNWQGLIPPEVLDGTTEAAERLILARERSELVTVVADYDCDGATACSVAVKGLSAMGIRANYFVPDRVVHGYGLSTAVVDLLAQRQPKPDLLLTVDNGISSVAAIEHAKSLGMDVIVTDHHLPGAVEPQACCIVNPNKKGCTFPSKNLAGVGVIYYVLLRLRTLLRERGVYTTATQPRLDQFVDLVALGTVADVVKLDKNNRILVAQGLKRIRLGGAQPGVSALYRIAGKDPLCANVRDFGFALGPRINAAGRLSSMESGIECLLATDQNTALTFAQELNSINSERRELETEMQQTAEEAIAAMDLQKCATLSLYDDCFNEGIVGLVASRIKERIHRPVFAFAPSENGLLKGSGRSIPGVHLRDMLDLVSRELGDKMPRFGGHAAAAGLTLQKEALPDFKRLFEETVKRNIDATLLERQIQTDGALAPDEINFSLIEAIDSQIWGQGFEAPLFANQFRVRRQTLLKGAHLKLWLELGGEMFDAIFFRHSSLLPETVTLAYRPSLNEYMGQRKVQLIIEAAEDAHN